MSGDGLDSRRRNGASTGATGEGPAQKASAPRLMRTVTLATVGIMAFGVDALSAFAHTSLARGQQMEAGAQRLVERYQDNAKVQAKTAAASRDDLAKQAATTLDENLKALWRVVVVPGANQQPAEQPANQIPAND